MATNNNLKRFSLVYTMAQLIAGVNIVGGKALAIMSDNLAENSRGDVLLNTNIGMATDDSEVATLLELPRLSKAELDASGLTEVYNSASVTIAVRGEIAHKVRKAHEEGARSIGLDIVGLTFAGNRVDQATGDIKEGAYLFNVAPGGIRIFTVDFEAAQTTKPAGEVAQAAAQRVTAQPPARDWNAIKAKVAALNATASVPTSQPVSTAAVMAKMLALGIAPASAAVQAPAIAASISPENWAIANTAQDEAGFKAILGAFSIQLA